MYFIFLSDGGAPKRCGIGVTYDTYPYTSLSTGLNGNPTFCNLCGEFLLH